MSIPGGVVFEDIFPAFIVDMDNWAGFASFVTFVCWVSIGYF
jgi:hypothetical protein